MRRIRESLKFMSQRPMVLSLVAVLRWDASWRMHVPDTWKDQRTRNMQDWNGRS